PVFLISNCTPVNRASYCSVELSDEQNPASSNVPRIAAADHVIPLVLAVGCAWAAGEPPRKSRPQWLHTTAAVWISSAQNGQAFRRTVGGGGAGDRSRRRLHIRQMSADGETSAEQCGQAVIGRAQRST